MDPYEEVAMLSHIVYPFSDIFIDTLNRIGKGTLKGDPKLLELYRKLQNVLEVANSSAVPNGNDVFKNNAVLDSNAVVDVFQQLRIKIAQGKVRWEFPVGTLLPDIWTDPETGIQYRMPHRVMSHQIVQLADGRKTLGTILCRANTLPKERKFGEEDHTFAGSSLWKYLNLDTTDGYLAGCSKELRDAMAEVEIGDSCGADSYRARCKVFVPTLDEVGVTYNGVIYGSEIDHYGWQYFHRTPMHWGEKCERRVFRDLKGRPQFVMLRSISRRTSVGCMDIEGGVRDANRREMLAVLPVSVVVGADVELESTYADNKQQITA